MQCQTKNGINDFVVMEKKFNMLDPGLKFQALATLTIRPRQHARVRE